MKQTLIISDQFRNNWPEPVEFDALMALDGEVFRQVARRRTLKFHLADQPYFIKIHRGVGWAEILKNLLQLRWPVLGAQNEYRAMEACHRLGIETMTCAAYGLRGCNPAELDSFVITESLENTLSLEECVEAMAERPVPLRLKRALIQRVAEMARRLHENGMNHRDLYICHFLLEMNGAGEWPEVSDLHLYLIDLHRMQMRNRTPFRWQLKDVAALHFSSHGAALTRTDRFRFIQAYTGLPIRQVLREQAYFWGRVEAKAQALLAKPIKG